MFKKRTQKNQSRRTRIPSEKAPSSKVFSYYSVQRPVEEDDADTHSARQARDENTAKNSKYLLVRRLGVAMAFMLILGGILYNARLHPSGVEVVTRGTPEQRLLLQDNSVYQAAAKQVLAQKPANQTKFTLNTKAFDAEMRRQFPEVAKVTIALPLFGSTSRVYIEPSPAALLFIAKDNKAYIIDTQGRVISTNTGDAPHGILAITDQSGISPKPGMQVLPSGDVKSIQTIIRQLQEKGIDVESMALPTAAQRLEMRVRGKPYYIKFTLHENVLQQVGAYIAVRQKLEREGVTPGEYIDVRVADRAYYR